MLNNAAVRTPRRGLIGTLILGLVVTSTVVVERHVWGQVNADEPPARPPLLEVDAPEGDRSDAAVGNRYRALASQLGDRRLQAIFDSQASEGAHLRDQETLVSAAYGRVDGTRLIAPQVIVNLPEGSQLIARLGGRDIRFQPTVDASEFDLADGTLAIVDAEGTVRVRATGPKGCRLRVRAERAGDEVSFGLSAADDKGEPEDVHVAMDLTTGIPNDEQEAPHGSIRYALNRERDGQPGPVVLKIQWVYDIARLRAAAT